MMPLYFVMRSPGREMSRLRCRGCGHKGFYVKYMPVVASSRSPLDARKGRPQA